MHFKMKKYDALIEIRMAENNVQKINGWAFTARQFRFEFSFTLSLAITEFSL